MLRREAIELSLPHDAGSVPVSRLWSRCKPRRKGHACTPALAGNLRRKRKNIRKLYSDTGEN